MKFHLTAQDLELRDGLIGLTLQYNIVSMNIKNHLISTFFVEHSCALRMLLIVILGAWLVVRIMRLGMPLATLLLWFGHLL